MIPISKFSEDDKLIFVSKNGLVKKTLLKYFSKISKSGIIAIKIRPDDELITVLKLEDENKDVFIGTKNGYAARFDVKQLKNLGRTAMGVRGIKLRENDEVIGALLTDEKTKILTLTKKGKLIASHLDQIINIEQSLNTLETELKGGEKK